MRPPILLALLLAACGEPEAEPEPHDSEPAEASGPCYGGYEGKELCNGVDDDGDGEVDEADALDARPWFTDGDGDDWGDPDSLVIACAQPAGTMDRGGDCDDGDPAIHPLVAERCDGIDNDCDGEVDEHPEDGIAGYYDRDGDGWGAALDGDDDAAMGRWCELPSGYAEAEGDCDDRDEAIHPEASEICGDGIDQDCDGEDLECAP
jgi:hypothetical protein